VEKLPKLEDLEEVHLSTETIQVMADGDEPESSLMGALFRASEHANNYLVEEPAYFLVTFTKDGPTEETEELYRGEEFIWCNKCQKTLEYSFSEAAVM